MRTREHLFRGKYTDGNGNQHWIAGHYTEGAYISPDTGQETKRYIISNEDEFFTPCRDCIMHVGGGCAEGRGNTQDEDGCIATYFYDCKLTDKMTVVPKRFVRYSAKVTPEILTAAGWKMLHENEAVVKMEKEIDEIYVNVDFRKRINKIDLRSDGIFQVRIDVATVAQLNTLFEIVGLPQFKI